MIREEREQLTWKGRCQLKDNKLPPKITEKLFQGRVEQSLQIAGWRVYHTWNSMRSAKGFPDIVAIHPKRKKPLVVEIKTETGKLTPEQEEWLALFSACDVDTWLLRPSMFDEFWEHVRAKN